jgi:hypothetical protein
LRLLLLLLWLRLWLWLWLWLWLLLWLRLRLWRCLQLLWLWRWLLLRWLLRRGGGGPRCGGRASCPHSEGPCLRQLLLPCGWPGRGGGR